MRRFALVKNVLNFRNKKVCEILTIQCNVKHSYESYVYSKTSKNSLFSKRVFPVIYLKRKSTHLWVIFVQKEKFWKISLKSLNNKRFCSYASSSAFNIFHLQASQQHKEFHISRRAAFSTFFCILKYVYFHFGEAGEL